MTIVVGLSPTHRTLDSLHLARVLALSHGSDLRVVAVVPAPWEGKGAHLDADYRDYLRAQARASLEEVKDVIGSAVTVRTEVRESPSISEGLVAAVREHDAPILVLGSSAMGLLGRVALGSITERLLHSSPVPVAVAPRGFRAPHDHRVTRVSIAYAVGPHEVGLVTRAAEVARQIGAQIRLVSFAVRPAAPVTSGVGLRAEEQVVDRWAQGLPSITDELNSRIDQVAGPGHREPAVLGRGTSWHRALEAVDWDAGDVMVLGSSRTARSARVFLGGTASKIARRSPVPVIVVPRKG